MAKNNFLLVSFVVLSLLVASSYGRFIITSKISKGDFNTICPKEKNPSFCSNFFKSNPQAKKLDLPGLAKLLIKIASKNSLDTQKQFDSLVKGADSPRSKSGYELCSQLYDDGVSSFNDALESLQAKDSSSVNIHVSAVLADADTCKDELSNAKFSPQLLKKISDINNLSVIVLKISNMLPRN